jgi:hypothetical protein
MNRPPRRGPLIPIGVVLPMHPTRLIAAIGLALSGLGHSAATGLAGDRPADPLLKLVPPDAAVTIVVEGVGDRVREFGDSPLGRGLAELPAVAEWKGSEAFRQFDQARREIESALGADLDAIRDKLLGEAVVMALDIGPKGDVENPCGLLLARVRDRALLDRLIRQINDAESKEGTLLEVREETYLGSKYKVRHFAPGTKPDEAYLVLDGGVFAWSNSESLIRGVLERRSGAAGLASVEEFRRVRSALPENSVASLFLEPSFLRSLRKEEASPAEQGDPVEILAGRYLEALKYFGVALQLRDGVVLHTHESLDPSRLDEPLRRWAARPGDAEALLRRVPSDSLLLAAGRVDLAAICDEMLMLLDGEERAQAQNILDAMSGMLLGKDPRKEIFPHLGPGIIAYVAQDGDRSEMRLAVVVAIELSGGRVVSGAIENGLRTLLALAALDPKRAATGAKVETVEDEGVRLTVLRGPATLLAYYVEPGLLAVGNSAESVAALAKGGATRSGDSAFESLRSRHFPAAKTFLFADLEAIHRLADSRRDLLARKLAAEQGESVESTRRDLDQVLSLARLFRAAYITREVEPDFSSVHHTIGLIERESPPVR